MTTGGISLSISTEGADAIAQKLNRLSGFSVTEVMDEVGSRMVASTQRRFATETGPDGRKWRPSLRAKTQGGQTMTDTARLRQSFGHKVGGGSVSIGTNMIYAVINQLGGIIRAKRARGLRFKIGKRWATKKSVTIPPRPFLGMDASDEQAIYRILDAKINRMVGA
jgi:phage virion morphogenesis protein